jgi:hypothetical protein
MEIPGPALVANDPKIVARLTDEFQSGTPFPNGMIRDERVQPSGQNTPLQYPGYNGAAAMYESRWTRFICEIRPAVPPETFTDWNNTYNVTVQPNPNQAGGRWYMVSKWLVQEDGRIERVLYRVPMGIKTWRPLITRIRLTMDSSKIGFIGPWYGYIRNMTVLVNYRLPQTSPESDRTVFQAPIR